MVCCAIGALMVATLAIWWNRLKAALSWRLNTQSALAALAATSIVLAGSGLIVEHLGHAAAHADEQALLSDIAAQPICRGGLSGVRAAASYRIARATEPKE